MKNSTMKNITEIFANSTLSHIVQRTTELNELQQKIAQLLPKQYSGLYRVLNLNDNLLVFEVQSATVRQGLWMQQTLLLRLIQQDYPQVSQLEFRVNPNFRQV